MANRYWVGGTNNWDGVVATKWAATSGGAGGESVPTTADDVFFDANSTGVVTIATGNTGAKSINCTGFTGTLTGAIAISVAGSVTLVAGMTYSHTGTVTFNGTGVLTTAGKTFSGVTVDGVGIALTLGDALNTSGRNVNITRGAFDTANYNVTCAIFDITNANIRTITLGSSTLTVTNAWSAATRTNLTLNIGTSQINASSIAVAFSGGGATYYNVSFTATSAGGINARTISGANTFNNLILNASATGVSQLSLSANQVVNGTFTCAGTSVSRRGFVRSNSMGTTRIITAAAISADNCDFRDITIAGAAAGASPVSAGNCGGNSGITFPAAKTVYRVGTGGSWPDPVGWASSSGGTGASSNFPLAQDIAVIDQSTPFSGILYVNSISTELFNLPAIDMSQRITGITFNINVAPSIYGSMTLGPGVTVAGVNALTFSGRSIMGFTSAGKTITFPIVIDASGGTFRLEDAFNSSGNITHTRGTFNANNYNVSITTFSSSNSNTRTITMGSGLWSLSGTGTAWNSSAVTALTFNKNTANILLTNNTGTSVSFASGPLTYNKLTIGGGSSTGNVNINSTVASSAGSFAELASTRTAAFDLQLGNSSTAVIDIWSVTGTLGNIITVSSPIVGSCQTFTLTNVTSGINYLTVTDVGELSGNKFYVGTNSTDGGNNVNVYFTNPPSTGAATGNMLMLF